MKKTGATDEQVSAFLGDLDEEQPVLLIANQAAFSWFLDVDDLFNYSSTPKGQLICLGLDVKAIKADAELSERQYNANDYKKLRQIGRSAARAINEDK
jgi:hypothetical protein